MPYRYLLDDVTDDQPLPAGGFSTWLAGMQRALRGEQDSDVPCDGCTACCTSSQFVHIGPDETETLAHIPAELLFPAPRLPAGNVLLGYDENGHCPMLIDGECSIYEHRPRTCRTYDCRVFPAAGVELDDDDKRGDRPSGRAGGGSTSRPRSTRSSTTRCERPRTFVREHEDRLPDDVVPANATQLAVLAIEVHDAFLGQPLEGELDGAATLVGPPRGGAVW